MTSKHLGYLRAIWWPFWTSQKLRLLGKNRLQIWTRGKAKPKNGYLDNGATLGYLRAIWWLFWTSQKL